MRKARGKCSPTLSQPTQIRRHRVRIITQHLPTQLIAHKPKNVGPNGHPDQHNRCDNVTNMAPTVSIPLARDWAAITVDLSGDLLVGGFHFKGQERCNN
ncbi:MAG: hypothetical protein AAGD32_03150 [Planctomycetota bacterium]